MGSKCSSWKTVRFAFYDSSILSHFFPLLGSISINEIAPRPQNSGHYTIEACETSQYENHLCSILFLPLGFTSLKVSLTVMVSLIGASSSISEIQSVVNIALTVPGASTHLYGKSECRKGRNKGHITVVAPSDAGLCNTSVTQSPIRLDSRGNRTLRTRTSQIRRRTLESIPLSRGYHGSDSDLPVILPAAKILDKFGIPYELTIV